jgi:RNA polymerase sigma factor (TIGR02999 family)
MPPAEPDPAALPAPAEITALLAAVGDGDRGAFDRLFEAVYAELRAIAHRQLRSFSAAESLDTTALVHEAYLKFSRQEHWSVETRIHFYRLAARAMRSVVIDRARRRGRVKRGGDLRIVELDEESCAVPLRAAELLAVDEALTRLSSAEAELAELVEWRFFAGLSLEEIAELLGVSARTVKRRWRSARAFLYQDLLAQGVNG